MHQTRAGRRRAEIVDIPLRPADFALVLGGLLLARLHREHLHFLLEAELFGHGRRLVQALLLLLGESTRSRVSVNFLGSDDARRRRCDVRTGVRGCGGGCQHRFGLANEALKRKTVCDCARYEFLCCISG